MAYQNNKRAADQLFDKALASRTLKADQRHAQYERDIANNREAKALERSFNQQFLQKIMNIVTIVTLFVIACRLTYPLIKPFLFGV